MRMCHLIYLVCNFFRVVVSPGRIITPYSGTAQQIDHATPRSAAETVAREVSPGSSLERQASETEVKTRAG